MKRRSLVIASHPDDEILGCGATIAKDIREGGAAYVLILGEGVTARDDKRDPGKRRRDILDLRGQAKKANGIVGVEEVLMLDFPDNRFDRCDLLDIVKAVEAVKERIRPDQVYTHHRHDLNIDHRTTFNAVMTACRPMKNGSVKEILCFEVPSSTEWNYPYLFCPNVFVDVSQTIDAKVKAFKAYKAEMKPYPHPRSEEHIRVLARYWGSASGMECAEAFEAVRIID